MSKDTEALPPHFRWNFAALMIDYVLFGIALTFVSFGSVLPAFVAQLTDSAPVIGLASTVFAGGWLLPQLAVARLINDKPRKKPYMLIGMSGRIFFWVIALGLWGGLARYPTAMLILFFVCLSLFAIGDGCSGVAWFDLLARAIPLKRRGRMIGISQVISGLAGIGVGVLVKLILEQLPFPSNYTLIFTFTGVVLIPSTIALGLIREPPSEDTAASAGTRAKGAWLKILTADNNFRRLIFCRLLVGLMGLTTSFYVVHASDVLHLPKSVVGNFVVAQTLAGVVASALLGAISERWGPHYVTRIGSAAAAVGPLFALVTHLAGSSWLVQAYPFVYAMWGVVNSSWMLGFTNYLLEIAPEGMRPAYVGLGNTILGVLTLLPIVGGWLLEATSYTTLFGLTTIFVTLGFLLTLSLRPSEQPVMATPSAEGLGG